MSARRSKFLGVGLLVLLVAIGLQFITQVLDRAGPLNGPVSAVALVAGAGIFAALFFGPVGRAIVRMLEGDVREDDETAMRLEDVEARLAELSLEQQRVGELEERLDFAERLLSQQGAPVVRELPEES
jgi:hypothetical protein